MKTPNIIDDYQDIVAEYNAEKREIMNYCNANDNKEHIIKILDWLYEECVSSGGDGDALWYSRYYDVKDIFPILQEFNNSLVFAFKDLKLNGNTILWGSQIIKIYLIQALTGFRQN